MNTLKSILRGFLNTLEDDGDKLLYDKQLQASEVCYEYYRDQNPFCLKCFVCSCCLDKWFSQQIKEQIGKKQCELINLKICCPFCMKNIRLTEIKKKQSFFSHSLNSLTEFTFKRDESYISCPSPDYKNIGWIDNKNCRKYLNCTSCNQKYQNPYKISFMNLIVNKFCPQDIKSRLYKIFFTKSCPNCKSRIQKYGSCRELTCSQCKNSFFRNCKSQAHKDFDCIDGYFLNSGSYEACNPLLNYLNCSDKLSCTSCFKDKYIYLKGYFLKGNISQQCTPQMNYLTCLNESSCQSCEPDKYIQSDGRSEKCGQGYYAENKYFRQCKAGCSICSLYFNCDACHSLKIG
ncbi:hypothetical protein ABPG72_019903 [Tetrahymena utriculariae]